MNFIHLGAIGFGLLQIGYGLVGLAMQWGDAMANVGLVMSGLTTLGLTKQNVSMGRALGRY